MPGYEKVRVYEMSGSPWHDCGVRSPANNAHEFSVQKCRIRSSDSCSAYDFVALKHYYALSSYSRRCGRYSPSITTVAAPARRGRNDIAVSLSPVPGIGRQREWELPDENGKE